MPFARGSKTCNVRWVTTSNCYSALWIKHRTLIPLLIWTQSTCVMGGQTDIPTSMSGKTFCRFAPVIGLYIRSSMDSADWCSSTTGFPKSVFSNLWNWTNSTRQWHEWHSQPLESIGESTRHAGNYFVPISIRPIFIFCCCRSYVKLLDYRRAEKFFSTSGGSLRPEAWGPWHLPHLPHS